MCTGEGLGGSSIKHKLIAPVFSLEGCDANLVVWIQGSVQDKHLELPEGFIVGQFLCQDLSGERHRLVCACMCVHVCVCVCRT